MAFLEASTEFQRICADVQAQVTICKNNQDEGDAEALLLQSQLPVIRLNVIEQEEELSICDQALVALTSEIQGNHPPCCKTFVGGLCQKIKY